MFTSVRASAAEIRRSRAGDAIVPHAEVVLDRGFSLPARPDTVWPWLVQLGKRRAGWYLPGALERLLPRSRRGARRINPDWQTLRVGDVIPDYGGRDEIFQVAEINPPSTLVYRSRRGRTDVSWSISLEPAGGGTRVLLRLRLGPVRHRRLAETAGELFDLLTIAGMAAGLRERLISSAG